MIYEIKDQLLEVINDIEEYSELIYGRFSQFKIKDNAIANNYLKFKNSSVEIYAKGNYKILKNKIVKTDIYPIINNLIAYLINDENNIFIHGITVSKEDKGMLIVGDFGQGKSTLAEEFEKNGYEINSTDQTWLKIDSNKLYQEVGSSFDIKDGKILFLNNNNILKRIQIDNIIRIVGLCDNGKVTCSKNENKFYIIKNLAYFCNWNYFMPIFTDDIELYNTNKYVMGFLSKLTTTSIEIMDIRGDKKKILKKLEE